MRYGKLTRHLRGTRSATAIGLMLLAASGALAQGAPPKAAAKSGAAQASAGSATTNSTGGAGSSGPFQGFSQNGKEPIHIDAARLEVRDKDKVATFSGDVKVKQGDTLMQARTLTVFYDQDNAGQKTASAAPAPGGSQKIRRLEAKGNVIVTQKDQTITGELAVFDMRSNTVTMSGGVLLTQGKSVMRGDSMVMDMTTGVAKVEPGKGGRINLMVEPQGGGPATINPMQQR
jgi:lipopolysaccharide export system protein LptA